MNMIVNCVLLLALNQQISSLHGGAKPSEYPFPIKSADPWGHTSWDNRLVTVKSEPYIDPLSQVQFEAHLRSISTSAISSLPQVIEQITPYSTKQRKTRQVVDELEKRFRQTYNGLISDDFLSNVDDDILWSINLAVSVHSYITQIDRIVFDTKKDHGLRRVSQYTSGIAPRSSKHLRLKVLCTLLSGDIASARMSSNELCIRYPESEGAFALRIRTWLRGNSRDAPMDTEKVTAMLDYAIKKWPNYPRLWYLYGWWHKGEVQSKYWTKYRNAKSGTFQYEMANILQK